MSTRRPAETAPEGSVKTMRKHSPGRLSLCVATVAAMSATGVAAPGTAADEQADGGGQPNILFIFTDDLGYADTSLYGGEIDTPNIARIAQHGVTFTDGYVAAPVCSPSRHSLLGGHSASRFGADSNFLGRLVLPDQADDEPPGPSMARVLDDQGYATMAIGKWDISGVRRGFTAEEVRGQPNLPDEVGFDEYYGMLNGIAEFCPAGENELFEYDAADDSYQPREPSKYVTDEFSDRAADYVSAHAGADDPFFLYLSYNAPHVPLQLPDDCERATGEDARPAYEEMVRIMDRGIGRVLTALDAADGTLGNVDDANVDNTMVVFVSDNGPQHAWQSGDLRGHKSTVFEGGIRVPFTMSWPARIDSGTTYSHMVSALDLIPTFARAAGAAIDPSAYDGVDLVSHVNSSAAAHDSLSWRYYNDSVKTGEVPLGTVREATRSADAKYIREVRPDGEVQEYLFDFGRDYDGDGVPDGHTELVNENANPAYREIRQQLIAKHNRWNEQNPVRESFDFPRQRTGLPDGWANYGGTWHVDDDASLWGEALDAGTVTAAGSYFRDFSAAVDIRLESEGSAGMLLRGADGRDTAQPLDGYRVLLNSRSDEVQLIRVEQGLATVVEEAGCDITTGTSHQVRATVDGDQLTVQVDGPVVLQWTDPAPLPGGSVGLQVINAAAAFDNLIAEKKP